MLVSLLMFGVNSLNSTGGYSADQHFQIIEFASFKLGHIHADDLAWEYRYKERQALQPMIVYGLFRLLEHFSLTEPLLQLALLRLLTGIFVVFCVFRFVNATRHFFEPAYREVYIVSSFLIWFLPCYYVHFGSETFAQALLLLGYASLFSGKKAPSTQVIAGIWFGLAFFARFQSAITVAGLFGGLLLFNRYTLMDFLRIASGAAAGICVGIMADIWFYGEFVFTPYRYFDYQLTKGVAGAFGTHPFYQYLTDLFWFSTPVFGLLIYFSFSGYLIKGKGTAIFLSIAMSIFVLSMIGHKEQRFLWQIMAFMPFTVVYGLQQINARFPVTRRLFFNRPLGIILILINTGLFILTTLKNNAIITGTGNSLAHVITRDFYEDKVKLYYLDEYWHPYKILRFNPEPEPGKDYFDGSYLWNRFLTPPHLTDHLITGTDDPALQESAGDTVRLLYIRKSAIVSVPGCRLRLEQSGYRLKAASVPLFIDHLLNENNLFASIADPRIVYLLEKQPQAAYSRGVSSK